MAAHLMNINYPGFFCVHNTSDRFAWRNFLRSKWAFQPPARTHIYAIYTRTVDQGWPNSKAAPSPDRTILFMFLAPLDNIGYYVCLLSFRTHSTLPLCRKDCLWLIIIVVPNFEGRKIQILSCIVCMFVCVYGEI